MRIEDNNEAMSSMAATQSQMGLVNDVAYRMGRDGLDGDA